MQSFMAPILNLQDTRISAPFFGPNVWTGILKPVMGGGIPAQHAFVEIKMTFKEGGAFDFHSTFERVRDSLLQAVENAQASGQELDPADVHLDELPAYNEVSGAGLPAAGTGAGAGAAAQAPGRTTAPPSRTTQDATAQGGSSDPAQGADRPTAGRFEQPNEPPPGYEEAQSSGVRDRMEESIRRTS